MSRFSLGWKATEAQARFIEIEVEGQLTTVISLQAPLLVPRTSHFKMSLGFLKQRNYTAKSSKLTIRISSLTMTVRFYLS